MFDGMKFDRVGCDRRFTFQFRDHFGDRANLGLADDVGTTKDNAGVGGARLDGEGDLLAGV